MGMFDKEGKINGKSVKLHSERVSGGSVYTRR